MGSSVTSNVSIHTSQDKPLWSTFQGEAVTMHDLYDRLTIHIGIHMARTRQTPDLQRLKLGVPAEQCRSIVLISHWTHLRLRLDLDVLDC
jgi:hypothetical protein